MREKLLLALLCMLLLVSTAFAVDVEAEQRREFGMDQLEDALPDEARQLLPEENGSLGENLRSILAGALPETGALLREALRTAVAMMAVVLLCSMVPQMESKLSKNVVQLVGTLAITLLGAGSLRSMIGMGRETLQEMQSFTTLLMPALASATAASGGPVSATALYAASIFISDLLMGLVNKLLMPLVYAYLAISASDAAIGNQTLRQLRDLVKWILTGGLKLIVFLFTAYLSLSGVISGASDQMAVKAAKLAVGSMVPVVGSMISDASETILGSARMLRNAAGIFGMAAVLAICLLPLLRLGIRHVVLKLTAAMTAVISEKPLAGLVEGISDTMGFLVGMTGACCFMQMVSCVCFLRAVVP